MTAVGSKLLVHVLFYEAVLAYKCLIGTLFKLIIKVMNMT